MVCIVLCSLLLVGCGSGSKSADPNNLKTICKDKEILSMLKKNKKATNFVLDQVYYELPVKLQTFIDNGWELNGETNTNNFVIESIVMEPNSYIPVVLTKNYQQIEVTIVNRSKEETAISPELMIEEIHIERNALFETNDFVIKEGITLNTEMEEAKAALSNEEGYEFENEYINFTDKNTELKIGAGDYESEKYVGAIWLEVAEKEDASLSDYLNRVEIKNESINKVKAETYNLKRKCTIGSKTYPEKKYKKLISDLKERKMNTSLLVKGKIVDVATATAGYDKYGFTGKGIYILEDSLGNKYAFYDKLENDISVPALNIGDEVQLFASFIELISTEDDGYYPLITPVIVEQNGVEVANSIN